MINLYNKSEVPSFICSEYRIETQSETTPFRGGFTGLSPYAIELAMFNVCTKFEVSIFRAYD